jgi:hypothetical protein
MVHVLMKWATTTKPVRMSKITPSQMQFMKVLSALTRILSKGVKTMTIKTETNVQTFPVLSIDAWGNQEEGYEWNNWHKVGMIDLDLDQPNQNLIQVMIDAGFLTPASIDLADVNDDGFNVVFSNKETGEPVFAIEYGSTI